MNLLLTVLMASCLVVLPWARRVVTMSDDSIVTSFLNPFWYYQKTGDSNLLFLQELLIGQRCEMKVSDEVETFCGGNVRNYYINGVIVLSIESFATFLEICSLVQVVFQIKDKKSWFWMKLLCVLRYNFLLILGPVVFYMIVTGTLFNIFSEGNLEPSWGIGVMIGLSLCCLIIRIHHWYFNKVLVRR